MVPSAQKSTFLYHPAVLMLLFLFFIATDARTAFSQNGGDSARDMPAIHSLTVTTGNDWLKPGNERLRQERLAMLILLGWGSANLLGGSALAFSSEGLRDFGLMTAGWGLVNAGIAAFALAGTDTYTAGVSFETVMRDEMLFNRILAVNSGLNAGYIATGFTMNYLGSSSRVRQFGSAVMVQGAFLMAFDAWLLWNSSARLNRLSAMPDTFLTALPDGSMQLFHGLTLSFGF
ncbi:MAG: hypothetical protein LAT75_12930 [Candidatus Cyclonatronum sp.]|uniref:DUF6992 family protein n=1 Tax=Cyclonatronum sp. TaxID=3024185 RepID=UPI0025C52ED8|nr:hypothetical protein [Cyclonatronum sp.]MCH8487766.1 hypothetical protein [Cyclonatronum sp.]